MMRSPHWTATAVRRPAGDILSSVEHLDSLLVRYRWLAVPVVRGVIVLYEALTIGIRALFFSANAALGDDEQLSSQQIGVSAVVGLALAVGLFFVLPTIGARMLERYLPTVIALNLAEGGIRIAVLITYIASIARLPDIRRVYEYHGAEHKAVNTYEAGDPLDVGAVRRHSRFHPRCGTSFLLIVMIVAIIVFSFLGRPALPLRILSRVLLIPVVAGVSYEIIRAGARYRWFRPLVVPGMWLQRLTTREPDDAQMEVAVRALRDVIDRETAAEPAVA
ncbi:MAG TPA: DUF1385 domain-containing protein [bacterium]